MQHQRERQAAYAATNDEDIHASYPMRAKRDRHG
jgi:hypothetical protein